MITKEYTGAMDLCKESALFWCSVHENERRDVHEFT